MTRSQDFFKKRVKDFRKALSSFGVDVFLIENPIDIFYFTGVKLSTGTFYITRRTAILCVDGRYMEMAKKSSPFPVRSIQEKALEKLWKSPSWKELFTIGFDTEISFAEYKRLKAFFSKLKRKLKPCNHPVQKQRAIKDNSELRALKKSAALLWKGFLHIRKNLKVGITESELALLFEWYSRKNGAEALSFKPIIAFGDHSALPHHHSGHRKLKKGDVVLVDIGVVFQGYMSDMTRVIFFGEVPKKMQEFSRLVKQAHKEVLLHLRPGVEVAKLDHIARTVMGKEEKRFLHSLGHGIGLNVHEYPLISKKTKKVKLEAGMVITIEPGLYLPGVGGIRHEDMFVITKTGYQNLLTL
jgi:Xaa-Pro aminopeptidase